MFRIFTAMLLSIIILHLPAHAAPLASGLQAYWQFNGSGDDSSPADRDVTIHGGAGISPGLLGQALDLSGKNQSQFADRPVDDSIFDIGASDFTIQVWVNYNDTTSEQILIEKWINDSGPGWTLTKLNDDRYRFHFDADVNLNSSPQSITTGVWHQLVARRSGADFSLFFDNDVIISANVGINDAQDVSNPLLIGRRNAGDPRDFSLNGLLDEIAFWDRAISDQDIEYLYNNGLGRAILVPEPSAFALLGVGAMMYFHGCRRRFAA